MKRNNTVKGLMWILLALAVITQAPAQEGAPRLMPTTEQNEAAYLSAQVLGRHHYRTVSLDDALSEKIFDRYLKALDPERMFFTQADIDAFADARAGLDDAILNEDLTLPFALFQRYQQRFFERVTHARQLLRQDFDFSVKEGFPAIRDTAPWPKDESEVRELWRKRVKNDWLRLKLAGKKSDEIRDALDRRYTRYLARMVRNTGDDVFELFMNAYATSLDPHTNYLGPSASDDFDIAMRLSLVGIGAVLQERDDYITIRKLVPGGAAARSGKLAVGDRIVGVGQGDNGPFTDVVGARVDEAVKLIRGAKDTRVRLDILPAAAGADGKHKQVSLIRDQVKLEEQAASKSVIKLSETQGGRRIGVIALPAFYEDFNGRSHGDKDFRSASHDVARLLEDLKKERIEGLVLDLRDNSGGSLQEAVDVSGLFIDKGPVVQQRRADGRIRVESDEKAGVAWDGPLAVLINRESASASEIVAAAIQDYGRGLVVGEPSFGKGTVQTIVSLDEIAQSDKPRFGELKMTVAQFFRINGGTTQLHGVTPDILFPALGDPANDGEASYDNALPWRKIGAARFTPAGTQKDVLPELQSRHQFRIAHDKDLLRLKEDIVELRRLRESSLLSLNEAERRKEKDRQNRRLQAREKDRGRMAPLTDDGLQSDERSLAADLAADKSWRSRKDVLLDEAARIVGDSVEMLAVGVRLTQETPRKIAAGRLAIH